MSAALHWLVARTLGGANETMKEGRMPSPNSTGTLLSFVVRSCLPGEIARLSSVHRWRHKVHWQWMRAPNFKLDVCSIPHRLRLRLTSRHCSTLKWEEHCFRGLSIEKEPSPLFISFWRSLILLHSWATILQKKPGLCSAESCGTFVVPADWKYSLRCVTLEGNVVVPKRRCPANCDLIQSMQKSHCRLHHCFHFRSMRRSAGTG